MRFTLASMVCLGLLAASGARTIPVTDGNLLRGLSPLNWARTGSAVSTAVGGASLRLRFPGTRRVELLVDTSRLKAFPPGRYPVLAWSVNGGKWESHQLAAGETSVVLTEGAADPTVELYARGFSPFENRFSGDVPENSVVITGFRVDATGSTAAVPAPPKLWLNIGDSIMSGDGALYAKGQGRPPNDAWAASDDARASYGYLLATHYGYNESRLAYGGYDWGGGGSARLPSVTGLIDGITSTVSRLDSDSLKERPKVVLINLGENGAPAASQVIGALGKIRQRAGPAAKMIVMIPVSGKARAEVTGAFRSYKGASHDEQAFLVDLGAVAFDTADGQHPTAAGHEAIFRAALPAFDSLGLDR